MPAVVQDGKRAFGYGPACAEKVRELLGEDPFETMLSVAIDDIKRASRPAEPRVAVIRAPTYLRLLSNLSRDPHPDGYVTSYTGGKVGGKSAAKRLRAEEQRKAALVHKPGGKKKAKK